MSSKEITLYVKIHNVTGLKYFGKTTKQNPEKYTGSGKHWKRHLKKHGYDVTTIVVGKFTDHLECQEFAINFSIENNIVESTEWANLIVENGMDGAPAGHAGHKFTIDQIKKISESSRSMWDDDEFRHIMSQKQKDSWTEERRQEQRDRLTGIKRPDHSRKLSGRIMPDEQRRKLRKPKHPDHGNRVSAALTGVSKVRVCRLIDKKEMSVNYYTRWIKTLTHFS